MGVVVGEKRGRWEEGWECAVKTGKDPRGKKKVAIEALCSE